MVGALCRLGLALWNFSTPSRELAMTEGCRADLALVMVHSDSLDDERVLKRALKGDKDAFSHIYRRMNGAVFRFAFHMTGCRAMAEDVTQETFLELIKRPERFDASRGSLSAYLYGIARNQVLRRLRIDKNYIAMPEGGEADLPIAGVVDPLDDLTRREMVETLRKSIVALPEHYREVIVLCDLHEMSYAEAAEVVGCSVGTIRSRMHRGRALLAEKLRGASAPAESAAGCSL